ncbi:MAG: hypothetical protein RL015_1397, partial [Verrucomicrobiota bacterium]
GEMGKRDGKGNDGVCRAAAGEMTKAEITNDKSE